MIVELGVGLFAIGTLGYAIYWRRERMKWARTHEKQMKRLKWLKRELKHVPKGIERKMELVSTREIQRPSELVEGYREMLAPVAEALKHGKKIKPFEKGWKRKKGKGKGRGR